MGTIKTTNIEPIADNGTVTLGSSGDTFTLGSGVVQSNMLYPAFQSILWVQIKIFLTIQIQKLILTQSILILISAYDTTNKRFVCPSGKAGKYFFISGAGFFLDDTRRVTFQFKKNGSNITNSKVQVESASASSLTLIRTLAIITLAATDYVEAFSEQENGDTKTMTKITRC